MTGPLEGQVALVAGATRGAGRGIARMLGEAGAVVYCTGRSTRGQPSPMNRPETIEETAELVTQAGGRAIAVRVDHTIETEVAALIERIKAEQGRLDVLVNDIWGGDPLVDWSSKFWGLDIGAVRKLVDQAIFSHLITARYAAPLMLDRGRGLIVEVGDGEGPGYRGHLLYDLVKTSVIRLAYAMAWDLQDTAVTALAITPGFLRSEAVLGYFGVSEADWQKAAEADPLFAESETPAYVGRAIAALAADPDVGRKAGASLTAGELALEYGFTDVDGRAPQLERKFQAIAEDLFEAPGELDANGRFFLGAAYMRAHRDPARRAWSEQLIERLGWRGLGEGLSPARLGAS